MSNGFVKAPAWLSRGLLLALLAMASGAACGSNAPASPPTSTPLRAATARPTGTSTAGDGAAALYAARCAFCHGNSRQGVPGYGPALPPGRAEADIQDAIANGRRGMSPFKGVLTSAEIDDLVRFLGNPP